MSDENQDLRDAGLKVTIPRLKILSILEKSAESHLSADDIYRQLVEAGEDVGIATVYRVLTQFESSGLVIRHNFDNGPAVYEIERGIHHDHMVDVDTGKVMEFHDEDLEKLQHEIVKKKGYELVDHSMILHVRKIES